MTNQSSWPREPLTDGEIQQVRAVRATRFQKWFATATGDKLELEF